MLLNYDVVPLGFMEAVDELVDENPVAYLKRWDHALRRDVESLDDERAYEAEDESEGDEEYNQKLHQAPALSWHVPSLGILRHGASNLSSAWVAHTHSYSTLGDSGQFPRRLPLERVLQNGNRWVFRVLYGLPSRANACCPSFWRCRYAPHPPPPVSVRPFRRRVDPAGATTRVPREARRPAAKVAHPAGRGCRLLPAALWMCLADAPARVPALADRLLSLPQMATGRSAAENARRAPGRGPGPRRARPGPQRGGDRQSGSQDQPGGRTRTRLRWGKAASRAQAPHPGGHQRARARRARARRRPPGSGRRATPAGGGLGREAPSSGAGVGRRGLHGRFPRVGPGEAGLACGGALPPRPATVALRAGGKAARLPGSAPALSGREDFRVAESGSPSEQGLRAAARDGRGDDLRGDEPAHAAQASAGSVKDFTPALQIRCLQNSF